MPTQVDLEKIRNSIPAQESEKKLLRNQFLTAFYKRVWWAPITFGVLLQFTIYGALVIAFSQNQLERWLPYVSDVGTKHPQASYFCMLLALCSLLMIISTYFRYSQVQYYLNNVLPLRSTQTPSSSNRNNNNNKPEKETKDSHDHAHQINFLYNVNLQSMLIGYGVAVGVLMIGSFRMGEYFFHHLTGCSLGVFGGGVSMIYQIALIHLLNKQQPVDHRPVERPPSLLAVLALVAMTSLALLSLFALILMYRVGFYNFVDMDFRHRWSPEVEGYELHAWSALLEWIALACLSAGCIDMGWRMRRFGREFPGWLQARREKLVRISSVSMACQDCEVYSISNVPNL